MQDLKNLPAAASGKPKLSDFQVCRRYKEEQTRYSQLCEAVSDAVDAVKLEIPEGLPIFKIEMDVILSNQLLLKI
ncbi:MAG: hypothetical protein KGY38_07235 [Desulfobacterales bacterium]|nr:hypothetical protein [Desulfobacterales bacterium]